MRELKAYASVFELRELPELSLPEISGRVGGFMAINVWISSVFLNFYQHFSDLCLFSLFFC